MNIGFIGAGKVGFSLGKYLTERNVRVTGYYSRNPDSSREAADFTNTRQYMNLRHLVEDSDVLFVAIPDSAIAPMWEQLKMLPIQNKIISHFSGSLSSAVFSDIERYHAYGYSIHPLFAINDKYESYKVISQAFFTIEGDPKYLNWFQKVLEIRWRLFPGKTKCDIMRRQPWSAICMWDWQICARKCCGIADFPLQMRIVHCHR